MPGWAGPICLTAFSGVPYRPGATLRFGRFHPERSVGAGIRFHISFENFQPCLAGPVRSVLPPSVAYPTALAQPSDLAASTPNGAWELAYVSTSLLRIFNHAWLGRSDLSYRLQWRTLPPWRNPPIWPLPPRTERGSWHTFPHLF